MSVVSTVIVTCFLDDAEPNPSIVNLNAWLEREGFGGLVDLCPHFGGWKAPQMEVYGGAFNYLNHDEFLAAIRVAGWSQPETVQVFICGEEDVTFTAYDLSPAGPTPEGHEHG